MQAIGLLTLPADLRRQVLSHARESRPKEAVGLLGGDAEGLVSLILPLPNIATGNQAFIADPFAQYCALRRLQSDGLQLLAIYHSHPDGGAGPSERDLAYANSWACVHMIVVVGVQDDSIERLHAFRFADTGIEEVEIR
jgi:proteasome lid subunit RPN8/RPN11